MGSLISCGACARQGWCPGAPNWVALRDDVPTSSGFQKPAHL